MPPGGITNAITLLRGKLGHMVKIEVETRNLDEVAEALHAGAEIIMLDNMSLEAMRKAVAMAKGKALIEPPAVLRSKRCVPLRKPAWISFPSAR